MRFHLATAVALLVAPAAWAAEKSVSSSQTFSIADRLTVDAGTLYADEYAVPPAGSGDYAGQDGRRRLTALNFDPFDPALGVLTRATLTLSSALLGEMGVNQMAGPDIGASAVLNATPSFSVYLSGYGVGQGAGLSAALTCSVSGFMPLCLSSAADRTRRFDLAQDVALGGAATGYSFTLEHALGVSWTASVTGQPPIMANATAGGEWAGTATLTYTYVDQATPGVPEPATWGLMVAGFGAVGAAMRARPRRALA